MKKLLAMVLCFVCICSASFAAEPGFAVYHGDREQKRICITVDDCKDTKTLKQIFDLGQQLEVPITFFTLGYVLLDEDKALWQEVAASNCEIGNHGYWHSSLPKMSRSEIKNNLLRVQERLDELLGYHYGMQVMRPPYGNISSTTVSAGTVLGAVREAGYAKAVLWDVSQTDPAKCIYDVENGSILLFHTLQKDLRCLEVLLPQLKDQGYEFVTVSQMFGLPPIETSPEPFVRNKK